jgi:hypothetical protein
VSKVRCMSEVRFVKVEVCGAVSLAGGEFSGELSEAVTVCGEVR